jgi:hypothetical protein
VCERERESGCDPHINHATPLQITVQLTLISIIKTHFSPIQFICNIVGRDNERMEKELEVEISNNCRLQQLLERRNK